MGDLFDVSQVHDESSEENLVFSAKQWQIGKMPLEAPLGDPRRRYCQ
jgi:hypothetical protein